MNSTNDERKIKVNKRSSEGRNTYLRVIFFSVAVVGILLFMIFSHISDDSIVTAYVQEGTITDILKADCGIYRNEESVISPFSGNLVSVVNEGERVCHGQTIAYVVADNMETVFEEMRNTERKLTAAKTAAYSYSGTYPEEYLAAVTEIKSGIREIAGYVNEGNISEYGREKKNLSELFRQKNSTDGEFAPGNEYINKLMRDLDELKGKLEGNTFEIKASTAGIVSFYTDGTQYGTSDIYSKIKSCDSAGNFYGFDCSVFDKKTEMKSYVGQFISGGTYIARIMPDSYCYLAVKTDKTAETTVTFYSENGRTDGNGTVVFNSNGYLVLRCSKGIESLSDKGHTELTLELSKATGMKVPVKSLTDWDAPRVTARLTVIKSGVVEYVYVEVLGTDREYAIIAADSVFDKTGTKVRVNDVFVVNYESVTEGKVM